MGDTSAVLHFGRDLTTCCSFQQTGLDIAGVFGCGGSYTRGRQPVSGGDVRRLMYIRRGRDLSIKFAISFENSIMRQTRRCFLAAHVCFPPQFGCPPPPTCASPPEYRQSQTPSPRPEPLLSPPLSEHPTPPHSQVGLYRLPHLHGHTPQQPRSIPPAARSSREESGIDPILIVGLTAPHLFLRPHHSSLSASSSPGESP